MTLAAQVSKLRIVTLFLVAALIVVMVQPAPSSGVDLQVCAAVAVGGSSTLCPSPSASAAPSTSSTPIATVELQACAAVTVGGSSTLCPSPSVSDGPPPSTTAAVDLQACAAVTVGGSSALCPSPSPSTTDALAAPAFTISSPSETTTVDSPITGFKSFSTGGEIASYSIESPAPSGLTFDTSTGALTGTPSSIQSATPYTITALNATGSDTQKFILTVIEKVLSQGSSNNPESNVITTQSLTPTPSLTPIPTPSPIPSLPPIPTPSSSSSLTPKPKSISSPKMILMSTVYFDLGSSLLTKSSKTNLDDMLVKLKKSPYKTVVINGFTDSVKGQSHSALSLARSSSVKIYILKKTNNIKVSSSGKGLSPTSQKVKIAMKVSRKAEIWVG